MEPFSPISQAHQIEGIPDWCLKVVIKPLSKMVLIEQVEQVAAIQANQTNKLKSQLTSWGRMLQGN